MIYSRSQCTSKICTDSNGNTTGSNKFCKSHSGQSQIPGNRSIFGSANAQEDNNVAAKTGDVVNTGSYEMAGGVTLNFESPSLVMFYEDKNGNGIQDADEDMIMDKQFKLVKREEVFTYEVNNGWNAMNFPFTKDENEFYNASEIRAIAAGKGIDIISIKKWYGKWVEYTVEGSTVYGKDFSIKPNEGYFVRASKSGSFEIFGYVASEPFPSQLLNGWSLVGVDPGYNDGKEKVYTSSIQRWYKSIRIY